MRYWIGLHTHRHGVSSYLFVTGTRVMIEQEFAAYLGDEYESDRDAEFLDLAEADPLVLDTTPNK